VKHRHLAEIEEQLALRTGAPTIIQFNPHLAPMRRGIATTITVPAAAAGDRGIALCGVALGLRESPFVQIRRAGETPDTAYVVGTNRVDIFRPVFDPRTKNFVITSAEDNLVKGASGQAVPDHEPLVGVPRDCRPDLSASRISSDSPRSRSRIRAGGRRR